MTAFKDKTVIVTGGSQGIGLAVSESFAAQGAKVIVLNRNPVKGNAAADKINAAGGFAESIKFDVSDISKIAGLIEDIKQRYGTIDVLVNNAGVQVQKTVEESTEQDWDKTFDINLKGVFFLSQAVLSIMKPQQSGKVVFISSVVDQKPSPNISLYSASKAGMTMLMKSMATEYAQFGININAVCPGNTATAMNQHIQDNPEFVAWIKERTPTRRAYLSTQNIADAVLFMASEKASAVHGVALPVDDGWLIGG